jgi:nicotinate-nucleotide adenylyltransferase
MKRVALFGGAFDPPHIGHLMTISRIVSEGAADEVWIVPSGERIDKVYHAEAHHRRRMIEILIQEAYRTDPRIKPLFIQLEEKIPGSFTSDLLATLKNTYAEIDFYLVIGRELVEDLPRWKDGDKLLAEGRFLVVSRPILDKSAPPLPKRGCMELSNPHKLDISLSSTEIRSMIKRGHVLSGMLTPGVQSYIRENKLYGA